MNRAAAKFPDSSVPSSDVFHSQNIVEVTYTFQSDISNKVFEILDESGFLFSIETILSLLSGCVNISFENDTYIKKDACWAPSKRLEIMDGRLSLFLIFKHAHKLISMN